MFSFREFIKICLAYLTGIALSFVIFFTINHFDKQDSEIEPKTNSCIRICGTVDKILFNKTVWNKNKNKYKCACITYN